MARKTKTELLKVFAIFQADTKTLFLKMLRDDLKLVKLKTNNQIKFDIARYKEVYGEMMELMEAEGK